MGNFSDVYTDSSDNSVLEPFEEDIKDPKVDNYLNRLGGSITGKPFQIYDYKVRYTGLRVVLTDWSAILLVFLA